MKATAKNMKKYREAAHLSPQALAERIVVTQKAVAAWERGDALPDFDTLLLIANALGVDVTELIYDRRTSEEYICSRPKRVKITVILAVIFLLILASVLFSCCANFGDERPLAFDRLLNVVLIPSVYAFGIAALASIGAIWYDFRVTCKILRIVLLGLGVTCVCFYCLILNLPSIGRQLSEWLRSHSFVFLLPGILFFLGCNK